MKSELNFIYTWALKRRKRIWIAKKYEIEHAVMVNQYLVLYSLRSDNNSLAVKLADDLYVAVEGTKCLLSYVSPGVYT